MVKKKNGLLYIFLLLLLIVGFFYWQNNGLQISQYILSYETLPKKFDGFRIAQISDMHGKTFGQKNSTLVKKIKKLNPDILLVTGDMMSSTNNDGGAFLDFLDEFKQACPVYMCLGNHEQIARWFNQNGDKKIDYYSFIEEVKKRGVKLLDNDKVFIERKGETLSLEGLTLELYHYSRRDVDNYDENLSLTKEYIDEVIGRPGSKFTILMAHNPSYFTEYAAWGAELTLSGHIHGGIIQVPFKGGLLSPERVFFPKYDAGLFEQGTSKMIVNRGLGYSVINFRLFNRPEVSFIELKHGDGSRVSTK